MERLTTKYNGLTVPKAISTMDRYGEADDCVACPDVCEEDGDGDCDVCPIQECFTRLGEYENTGLTPEDVVRINDFANSQLAKTIAKLQAYERTGLTPEEIMDGKMLTGWIPVEEGLPETEREVLISAEWKSTDGKVHRSVAMAMYEDGKVATDSSAFSWENTDNFEYDEEEDIFMIPEGWWEQNSYSEHFGCVDDKVVAWMPKPKAYKKESANERD